MSADLLAEFESFYQPRNSTAELHNNKGPRSRPVQPSNLQPVFAPTAKNQTPSADDDGDEDDFGEFEVAEPATAAPTTPKAPSLPSSPTCPRDKPLPARPKPIVSVEKPLPKPRDDNVLFDAEEDFDDDFGDFEEGPKSPPVVQQPLPLPPTRPPKLAPEPQQSLIDFDDIPAPQSPPPPTVPVVWSKPAQQVRKEAVAKPAPRPPSATLATLAPSAPSAPVIDLLGLDDAPAPRTASTKAQPVAAPEPEVEDDAEWDDFEAADADESPAATLSTGTDDQVVEPLPLEAVMASKLPVEGEIPPTNIPPPAILLTLFPTIAEQAQTQLFDPVSKKSNPQTRDRILQLSETRQYLSSLIECSTVLARIIAGRKNRWKRDKMLSQSMSIGQAGRSGGMKLAGVSKAEKAREEREVSDAVRAWQAQLGRLKTAINAAGKLGALPEISETYIVRVAPTSEGAISSTKACVLCGLKRNERIAKVDKDVQDSFGEWWVEHWGHHDCTRLWYAQKDRLKSR